MKYLFYVAKYYSIPIVKPMVEYLDREKKDKYAFLVSKKVSDTLKADYIWQDKTIYTEIKKAAVFQPDVCISPGNYIDFRLPGIKAQIFHGIGIEKESHYKIRHFFDVYFTSGPVVTGRFNELAGRYGYFLVRETGWPKMDHILNFPSKNIRDMYGLPENQKIVLYSPTFSGSMHSGEDLLHFIPRIIKDNEIWIIKFHEFMNKNLTESLKNQSDKIRIIETYDITPYLHIADVMISDTSSVLYEFMALDKPVITYKTVSRKDKGINILSPSELRPALDRALEKPDEQTKQRQRHLSEVNPYLDGKTSQRIFDELRKIKNNNELPKRKKPLNLYRKIRILYHEKFKKGYLK